MADETPEDRAIADFADLTAASTPRTEARLAAFVRTNTVLAVPSLVPEIRLYLATEVTPLWQASEKLMQDEHLPPPFWAFAWPGGQAVARYILDHPETVRGRRVIDIGTGSGLVAIAAALAGARSVVAADEDEFACVAVGLNAATNGVSVEAVRREVAAWNPPEADVVLAGDVCYERAVSDRIVAWLRARSAGGCTVLLGDPGRAYVPTAGIVQVAAYAVPTSPELESGAMRETRIWRLDPS